MFSLFGGGGGRGVVLYKAFVKLFFILYFLC